MPSKALWALRGWVGAGMGLVALGGLVGASEGMWWFRGRFGVVLTEN